MVSPRYIQPWGDPKSQPIRIPLNWPLPHRPRATNVIFASEASLEVKDYFQKAERSSRLPDKDNSLGYASTTANETLQSPRPPALPSFHNVDQSQVSTANVRAAHLFLDFSWWNELTWVECLSVHRPFYIICYFFQVTHSNVTLLVVLVQILNFFRVGFPRQHGESYISNQLQRSAQPPPSELDDSQSWLGKPT